jgi:outer membrane protein TolC
MIRTLGGYVDAAQAQYRVGRAAQTDVLQAETQLTRIHQQQIVLELREAELQATLTQLAGRETYASRIEALPQALASAPAPLETLLETSSTRPRAAALAAERDRAQKQVESMQREYYPDIDVKLSFGHRQSTPEGMPRDDMVSLTFGVNLPIWRKQRLEPRVAEARAERSERDAMLNALRLETRAQLTQRYAAAEHARHSVELFDTSQLPAAEAAVNAALASYRVGKVDFLTLLDSAMRLFEAQIDRASTVMAHNQAVAELDYLAGRIPAGIEAHP